MYYAQLNRCSVTDGPGIRISLYVSGCRNHCPGCHNTESWNFNFGKEFTESTKERILSLLAPEYVTGFTVVGGEPMEPENQKVLVNLVEEIKMRYPEKTIWCYTGYEFTDLLPGGKKHTENTDRFLKCLDALVTGRFILAERDVSDDNRWRGSRNQRVVDVKESLLTGKQVNFGNLPNND